MKSIKQHFNEYQNNGGTMTLQEFKNDGRIDQFEVIEYYFHIIHGFNAASIKKCEEDYNYYTVYLKATSKSGNTVLPKEITVLSICFEKNAMSVGFNYSQLEKHLH